jgi:hypothetical protein
MALRQSSDVNLATSASATSSPSLSWRRWAVVAAAAGQTITISALTSADPLAVSWAALLLAITPLPLAALAALAPRQYGRPTTLLALVVLVVGMAGGITHTGLFFLPELAVLVFAAIRVWGE